MSDWFSAGRNASPVNLPELWDSIGMGHMQRVVAAGALVSLGLTSDGGAFHCSVTLDGQCRREYFRDPEDFGIWAAGAAEAVEAASRPTRNTASPVSRERGRRGR